MRALSVKQPYASAILSRLKQDENRPEATARLLAKFEGRWIWLHASKGFYSSKKVWREGLREEVTALWPDASQEINTYPRGSILGAMLLGETYRYNKAPQGWLVGPFCTRIEAVLELPRPVPAKGALGLWRPSEEVLEMVCGQIARGIGDGLVSELTGSQAESLGLWVGREMRGF